MACANELFGLQVRWIQLIRVFKTHTKYFLIGSNKEESRFKVLKIDREQAVDLVFQQSSAEYNLHEISEIISTLHAGNSGKSSSKFWSRGLVQSVTAFGILGFVRFLEGYYMILITKRVKVAEIGGHRIYKVEDTSMVYIPNSQARISKPEESKYLKSFQTVDLSSNFYFSYSYDLSNTLQHTFCMLHSAKIFCKKSQESAIQKDTHSCSSISTLESWNEVESEEISNGSYFVKQAKNVHRPITIDPCQKFVWNTFLLQSAYDQNIDEVWFVNIIHGFVSQIHFDVFGSPIYVTLISRRSNRFAGTRFMKRGCNIKGDVANEVETEQVAHLGTITSFEHGKYTSFVQHRGSVPVHWFQDITANVVPAKPAIHLAMPTPFTQAPANHFNELLQRFGSPVVVLNLVRKRERKQRETLLGSAFKCVVEYLNLFLTHKNKIIYHPVDMAQLSHSKNHDVLSKLSKICLDTIAKTGVFQSQRTLCERTLSGSKAWSGIGGTVIGDLRLQTGILRTNCVDCLDRTNSAQFIAAKCALGYQLFAMGVLPSPNVEFDTPAMSLFEEVFENHGDIIALQYGGSQLVHTIQSYRKTEAPITAHSRDIVTTLSRYYTNTFSDAYKQNAINLFLGVFQPSHETEHLWESTSDYYLHNDILSVLQSFETKNYKLWCDPRVQICLPISFDFVVNSQKSLKQLSDDPQKKNQSDWFSEYYDCSSLTSFDEIFSTTAMASTSQIQEALEGPFATLGREKSQLHYSGLAGSISSSGSSDCSTSGSEGDNDSSSDDLEKSFSLKYSSMSLALQDADGSPPYVGIAPETQYGNLSSYQISRKDMNLYKRHVKVQDIHDNYIPLSVFSLDTSFSIEPPTVDKRSRTIYENSVKCCSEYPAKLLTNVEEYRKYVAMPR